MILHNGYRGLQTVVNGCKRIQIGCFRSLGFARGLSDSIAGLPKNDPTHRDHTRPLYIPPLLRWRIVKSAAVGNFFKWHGLPDHVACTHADESYATHAAIALATLPSLDEEDRFALASSVEDDRSIAGTRSHGQVAHATKMRTCP